ncbi:ABC transporter ATP-binding protein [Tenuibacillus multivorans]|uniref:ABC-2 type transport system ATP-binding protein n=1 Tax=Tenuibacillus multivorans TaxID=237069 RepID=A0A1H0FYW5_9BACI|nr:ABC transporter ATP-binding protein [Tenuibacillus multivorans]GEL78151.1 putative ABC transporter ATP-binding protein YxlF [Tenuibacillus multivorans]SDN99845.1 ABC-2 type transport system ATP-binding protein [Tenuibacillus multivorans]
MALLEASHLTKTYKDISVVNDVSFSLEHGKCVALLGPNGSGKTTTLRMLAGFIKPTDGNISFNEDRLSKDFRNYVGYLPQFPVFHNWMSGKEFLIYAGQLAHLSKTEAIKRADELLDLVNLKEVRKLRISKYSGGMKQRLGIAQALIHAPKLIILDEPASALDPIGRREVLNLMRELKKDATILFSTHILNDAEEVSDEILLLNEGKIIEQGSMHELESVQSTVTIKLSFTDEPKFIEDRLKEIESVFKVTRENNDYFLTVHDLQIARKQLLEVVHRENWQLTRFEVAKTSLEDLFMKAVKK